MDSWRTLHESIRSCPTAITLFVALKMCRADLAPEEAIGKDEVDGSKHHADDPPDQTHRLTILRGRGILDGQAVSGIDGRQHLWIETEGGAGKQPNDKGARGEKGGQVAMPEVEVAHRNQAHKRQQGEDEAPGAAEEAVIHVPLHNPGRNCSQYCQHNGNHPEESGGTAGASAERVGRFDRDIGSSVCGQSRKRHQADQDGVPVENAGVRAERVEVRPERLEEGSIAGERHTTQYIRHRGTEEDGEQRTANKERTIPE